ncbi:hypothetical protein [Granulicatella adiacens]|uniref:hypothetical protein n=1 Tax=Granulicatella adiacens TaxID=46124 RepID=UPI004026C675
MKTITIELKDNGFKLKGIEDIESRSECIWLMLAARKLGTRALEKGYLPELMEEREERVDESKDKVRFLTKEEQEGLGFGNPVSPTYLSIELPKNVPSKIKPIVILPRIGCERVTVKAAQYEKGFTEFETTLDLTQSHIINLNTGVE